MEQLIDKSALVAKIEKCYNECLKRAKITDSDYWNAKADAYRNVLAILNDTLEVKEVELEKEINGYFKGWGDNEVGCFAMMQDGTSVGVDDCIDIAKHFFELGLKAQKL